MYYYGARYYNPRISIFISVDPLAEQTMEPYLYTGNNPIMFTDPTGMSKQDDFVFNENGDFVRIDKNDKPDKIVIEDSQTGARENYWFADPNEDPQQIRDGIIKNIIFVSEGDVQSMLREQGAFDSRFINFGIQSQGGGDFDYSYSVLPYKYTQASSDPLNTPSSALFLPEGDFMAHNQMNFGNFLWAATGYTVGLGYGELQAGAHLNSRLNSERNGYPAQWDSKDDQRSIVRGAHHAQRNNYRKIK